MISFKNKNILITGASGGIGNALVKKFVTLGGNVLGTGTKTEKLDMIKKQNPCPSPTKNMQNYQPDFCTSVFPMIKHLILTLKN